MIAVLAAVHHAAHRLDLYRELERARTIEDLIAARGWGTRRLSALIDVLVATGAFIRDADGRVQRAGATPEVVPAAGSALLAEIIRRDAPFDPARDGLAFRIESQALAVAGLLHDATGAPAAELATRVLASLPTTGVLLDAGGGHGDLVAHVLDRSPTARAVLIDRRARVGVALVRLVRHAARFDAVAVELAALETKPFADVAVLNNVLHENGPEASAQIIAQVTKSLRPGGELLIKEPQRDRDPIAVRLFALGAAVFTADGDVFEAPAIQAWMGAAGLEQLRIETLTTAPEAALYVGRRP